MKHGVKDTTDIRVYTHVAAAVIGVRIIAPLIKAAARAIQLKPGFLVSVHIVGETRMRTLNRMWRKKDKATNVLAFAAQEGPRIKVMEAEAARDLGDIMVCPNVAIREASLFKTTPANHIKRLIVHGFLHLAGYDHEHDHDAHTMETIEKKILARKK
jgi:probable rRNA maturation factor